MLPHLEPEVRDRDRPRSGRDRLRPRANAHLPPPPSLHSSLLSSRSSPAVTRSTSSSAPSTQRCACTLSRWRRRCAPPATPSTCCSQTSGPTRHSATPTASPAGGWSLWRPTSGARAACASRCEIRRDAIGPRAELPQDLRLERSEMTLMTRDDPRLGPPPRAVRGREAGGPRHRVAGGGASRRAVSHRRCAAAGGAGRLTHRGRWAR